MGLGLAEVAILLCIGLVFLGVVSAGIYFFFIKKKE